MAGERKPLLDASKCTRCGGIGVVHGIAEEYGMPVMASWPCERCNTPKRNLASEDPSNGG